MFLVGGQLCQARACVVAFDLARLGVGVAYCVGDLGVFGWGVGLLVEQEGDLEEHAVGLELEYPVVECGPGQHHGESAGSECLVWGAPRISDSG